jgi:hypothetical protein
MPTPFDVELGNIGELNPLQLTALLRKLLLLDASTAGISLSSVQVSLKIVVSDGGEDGRISWREGPDHTEYVPGRLTQFQCKAQYLGPTGWKKEIFTKEKKIKPNIDEALSNGGTYVGFTTQSLNVKEINQRVEAIRAGLRRARKSYAKEAAIRIYDANMIATWTSRYQAAVLFVKAEIGRPLPFSAFDYERWSQFVRNVLHFAFVPTPALTESIQLLRNEMSKPRSVTRIAGLSGLGKTRLVYEAFSLGGIAAGPELTLLQNRLIFLRASIVGSQDIKNLLAAMIVEKRDALLVVDDCPLELHAELQSQMAEVASPISLLTLDYSAETSSGTKYIRMSPLPTDTIKEMVRQTYKDFSSSDIERIAEFAAGFPKMAELLAAAQLSREESPALLKDDILLRRMLWGRTPEDGQSRQVLMVLSLFDHFGAYEDLDAELKWISTNIAQIDFAVVFRVVQEYVERGILQRNGRLLHMIPEPLAIRLAADWWRGIPHSRAQEILSLGMPQDLALALGRRLSHLDFLPNAKEFVAELCGPEGPFGRAEGLFSETGSSLFRSISETNPDAAADAVWRVLQSLTAEQIHGMGRARRNIVWALEKLLFLDETFSPSARALFRLATYEDETWSNNATGVLKQIFALYLPGTEASYESRLLLVKEILDEESHESFGVLAEALANGYRTGPFTRSGSSERIGSSPPHQDFRPKRPGEIFSYWDAITEILTRLLVEYEVDPKPISKSLAEGLHSLTLQKRFATVDRIIAVAPKMGDPWKDALDTIDSLLARESDHVDREVRAHLEAWRNALLPATPRGKLRFYISEASWHRFSKTGEGYQDETYVDAMKLAEEVSGDIATLLSNLDVVCIGEQRHAFSFGKAVADRTRAHEELIEQTTTCLAANSDKHPNVSFLSGVLLSLKLLKPTVFIPTLADLLETASLQKHAIRMVAAIDPDSDQLSMLLDLAENGTVETREFELLAYGGATRNITPVSMSTFLTRLSRIDPTGANIAIEILFMYQFGDPSVRPNIRNLMIELLSSTAWQLGEGRKAGADPHNLMELLKVLQDTGGIPLELAKSVLGRVVGSGPKLPLHANIDHLIALLLSVDIPAMWKVVSEVLLGPDFLASHSLQMVLRDPFEHETQHVLDKIPEDLLWDWCVSNPERAPAILLQILPPFRGDQEAGQINPLVLRVLERYSNRSDVFSALSANIGTYSTWGSAVPHLSSKKAALSSLLTHPDAQIRSWATSYVDYLEREVRREVTSDAERNLPR